MNKMDEAPARARALGGRSVARQVRHAARAHAAPVLDRRPDPVDGGRVLRGVGDHAVPLRGRCRVGAARRTPPTPSAGSRTAPTPTSRSGCGTSRRWASTTSSPPRTRPSGSPNADPRLKLVATTPDIDGAAPLGVERLPRRRLAARPTAARTSRSSRPASSPIGVGAGGRRRRGSGSPASSTSPWPRTDRRHGVTHRAPPRCAWRAGRSPRCTSPTCAPLTTPCRSTSTAPVFP